jgi:hypothetical protein
MHAHEVASQLERSLQTSVDDVRLVAQGEHIIVQCKVFGTLAAARVSSRPRATLEAEHRLIAAGGAVAPVIRLLRPEPVPIPAGNVSLFIWEEGPPFAPGDAAYYEAAAETLAALHRLDVNSLMLERAPVERIAETTLLSHLEPRAAEASRLALQHELPRGIVPIHGDPLARNFIRSPHGAVLIDFADGGAAHPEYDVAAVLYQAMRASDLSLWHRFAARYAEAGGTAQLEPFFLHHALVRFIAFIVSWLETFVGPIEHVEEGRYLRWLNALLSAPFAP